MNQEAERLERARPEIDEVDLLERAVKADVLEAELAYLETLPPDRAALVLRRLDAVMKTRDRVVGPGEGARLAGLSRSAFHTIRTAWSRTPSLSVLTPFSTVAERPTVGDGASREAATIAKSVVEEAPPYVSVHVLARETIRRTGGKVAMNTALRLVRLARRHKAVDPAHLAQHYGSGLLVDLCAIDLPVIQADRLSVAAMVVETVSGLVMGAAAGSHTEGIPLQSVAVARARAFLRENAIDVLSDRRVDVEWIVPDGLTPQVPAREFATTERSTPVIWEVTTKGERRFGSHLVDLLGKKIGRVALLPRATAAGGPVPDQLISRRSPIDSVGADALVNSEVSRHNAPVLASLSKAREDGLALRSTGVLDELLAALEIMARN